MSQDCSYCNIHLVLAICILLASIVNSYSEEKCYQGCDIRRSNSSKTSVQGAHSYARVSNRCWEEFGSEDINDGESSRDAKPPDHRQNCGRPHCVCKFSYRTNTFLCFPNRSHRNL